MVLKDQNNLLLTSPLTPNTQNLTPPSGTVH